MQKKCKNIIFVPVYQFSYLVSQEEGRQYIAVSVFCPTPNVKWDNNAEYL